MVTLRRLAEELNVPERTLRRAAAEGLLHGRRVSPRRFEVSLREESYLRGHWPLLGALRAALRTEPNVRLAVLFGSTAAGADRADSDIDLLVAVRDSNVGRLAEMSSRLTARIGRDVQLVRLGDAEATPALMIDVIDGGRVLIDRDNAWHSVIHSARRWRRGARALESGLAAATLDG